MSGVAHPSVAYGKTGILLVNLGTPDSPDARGLRPYLKQFLSDRRVIETSPFIWQPLLRGIILNTRPRKSARAYAKIWNDETNESPLRYFTRLQAEKLRDQLGDTLEVEWAMRYGAPSIADKLAELKARGCERISVIALYPQYSASTSASVYDEVFRALLDMRWQPAVRTAAPWHDLPAYITALQARCARITKLWTGSRMCWWLRFTGCRKYISTRATPITAIAQRPPDCCAKN